jgi:HNH endonuclease
MRDRKSDAHMKVLKVAPGNIRHHKDENKENNAPSNLEEKTRSQHSKDHARTPSSLKRLRKALSMPARKEKLY